MLESGRLPCRLFGNEGVGERECNRAGGGCRPGEGICIAGDIGGVYVRKEARGVGDIHGESGGDDSGECGGEVILGDGGLE